MATLAVHNPRTGQFLYEVEEAGDETVTAVFQRARAVQPQIAAMSVAERAREIVKISDYLVAHREAIIDRLVAETGKTRFEALSNELFEVCGGIDYFRDAAPKILADRKAPTPLVLLGKKSKIVFEPLGTVLVIAPWNYPLVQCFTPSLQAFLAGNAVVFKPSEVTPLRGLYEEIMRGAGFMPDAIQIVYGGKEVGARLIQQRPDKIHFTGSSRAGRQVMAAAAEHLIPVELELGGKDAAIVFADVEVEKAANGIVWAAFTNAGQACTAVERCFVEEPIYEEFVAAAVKIAQNLRVATAKQDGRLPDTCDMGSMTAEFQVQIVEKQLAEAVAAGANVLCGGARQPDSLFFPPTVVVDVTQEMALGREETFGPVLPIMKFQTEAEAIALANDSPYGLGASVWSADLARAERVARALKVGNVAINNHMLTEANPALPYGGVKASGYGRYKGDWGLLGFSNVKALMIGGDNDHIESHWYPFTPTKYALFGRLMEAFFRRPRAWVGFLRSALPFDSLGSKEKIQ
ncbi:MAG: aldehyde dehydrogenase family protein [Ardenticatenaceae bacterium]|nr:aldehyde dehydrogenase family protein [Ardenticatenaceae bacterium]